jgi:p-hydroxybenzoate 3-monooxygenase
MAGIVGLSPLTALAAYQIVDNPVTDVEWSDNPVTTGRTQVAIIGGGPAGLLLARMLHLAGVECMILERQTKEYVMARIRAGVLEQGSVDVLRELGVGDRMDAECFVHEGTHLAFAGRMTRIDFMALTGKAVTVYGQTEVTKDLYDAHAEAGVRIVDEADQVTVHAVETDAPHVTYVKDGATHRLDADIVAGCDGFHGVSRQAIPGRVRREYERVYPFGWLGVLSETPPIAEELIYANHERGFALCSMRNEMLSRYYVQCPLTDTVDDWSDDRFWEELVRRLPPDPVPDLVTGPSIEKSIAPLRSFVSEPMRYGNLYLAGDSAHIVPPTGAKGLNLAVSDVHYLGNAIVDHFVSGSSTGLDEYSDRALARVWKSVRFSWWMTTLLHLFPDQGEIGQRIQEAELQYLAESEAAQIAMAENYVGLPF